MTGKYNLLYLHETARLSGAENSLLNLVTRVDRTQFNPYFICPEEGLFAEELRKLGINIDLVKFPKIRRGFGVFKTVGSILQVIRRKNIHLIHSNSIRTNIYSTMAGRLAKIPVVWHQRNLITNEIVDLDRLFSFLPDRIICNSQAIARRFIKRRKLPGEVTVIYNGVDTQRFNSEVSGAAVRREFSLRESIVVGIISRLGADKGQEYFLQAAKLIISSQSTIGKNVKFLVIGNAVFEKDRWREDYLKKMSKRLNLDNFVTFTGFRRDMPDVIAAIDIMVLASEAEPCGRVLIESMASGKPIVATNTGGTPEIVLDGETGILIPPCDSEAMAKAMIELLRNKEKAIDMGRSGRKRAEDIFSIEKNVKRIEEIYLSLLKK